VGPARRYACSRRAGVISLLQIKNQKNVIYFDKDVFEKLSSEKYDLVVSPYGSGFMN
jgi:hypothetical protein